MARSVATHLGIAFNLNVKQRSRQSLAFSRHQLRPSFAAMSPLEAERAQGRPGIR
jgi:hypothetical protein